MNESPYSTHWPKEKDIKSLDEITDAWGIWFGKNHSLTCVGTASTNYDRLRSYFLLSPDKSRQVSTRYQSPEYESSGPPPLDSSIDAFETWYDNRSDVTQQVEYEQQKASMQSFTWSITEAVSLGITTMITAGLPPVASVSQTLTAQFSLSATQENVASQSQMWTLRSPINIPPQSSVMAEMVIAMQDYNINFTVSVQLQGYVVVLYKERPFLWFYYPIGAVLQDCIDYNVIDIEGYWVTTNHVAMTRAKGVLTGNQGISVGISVKQVPLGSRDPSPGSFSQGTELLEISGEELSPDHRLALRNALASTG